MNSLWVQWYRFETEYFLSELIVYSVFWLAEGLKLVFVNKKSFEIKELNYFDNWFQANPMELNLLLRDNMEKSVPCAQTVLVSRAQTSFTSQGTSTPLNKTLNWILSNKDSEKQTEASTNSDATYRAELKQLSTRNPQINFFAQFFVSKGVYKRE